MATQDRIKQATEKVLSIKASRFGITSLCFLSLSTSTSANPLLPNMHFQYGTRSAELQWSIGLFGLEPAITDINILSELTYRDLEIDESQFALNWDQFHGSWSGLRLEMQLARGEVTAGTAQDSDYDASNRSEEFSRSLSSTKGSTTERISIGTGWELSRRDRLSMVALVGYRHQTQALVKREGEQTVSTSLRTPTPGPINGLDSHYDAQWQSVWGGIDLHHTLADQQKINLRIEHHWADYYAAAHWNLRRDLAQPTSFEHFAIGRGLVVSASYLYPIGKHWAMEFSAQQEQWQTKSGLDRIYFSNGSVATTRFNEATWESTGYHIGIRYTPNNS